MKTSELKTAVHDEGLELWILENYIAVVNPATGTDMGFVDRNNPYVAQVESAAVKELDKTTRKKLIKLLFDYGMTPLEEREDMGR
ncbi:hypothetical protein [Listeria newyorkensis]|uniref:hypothetical protein n=1 Tax=Listeria newyorkensis TaxID=1497681 RepID=UPI00051D70BB|nr:hypothetical protein [Listeria newyorkensis]KGL44108.1 hypothetical protein EP58_06570 [Listeria newyorkensis]SQC57652.1 Uncharacterised protein [Listeria newyorkensis]